MTDIDARLGRALAERYTIERTIGRGGMAEVYLARDLRYGRPVALKVLTSEVAEALGPDRFLREIEIAARLVHPRIVPLLDSGVADGLPYYAMPFIEGESLRQRLDRERQLPLDDAVEITRQVAAALAHAHGHGIVHRDIKPENILLQGAEALVADFGIARAVSAAAGERLTRTGIAVGTPVYMSPEQASGDRDVDVRSDQYSLACVLYEMLAGEPPFTGPTAQAIMSRKVNQPAPDVTLLRDSVPPEVSEALRRALSPVPADRYASTTQFTEALRRSTPAHRPHAPRARTSGFRRWERPLWFALGLVVALLGAFAARQWRATDVPAGDAPVRMTVTLPPGVQVVRGPGYEASSVALSPDGRSLVVAGTSQDGLRLYLRPLDRLEWTALAGTEGGSAPFFSPDGAWIGFIADGRLRKAPVAGGAVIDLTPVPEFLTGASWSSDERIMYGFGVRAPIHVVDASGGTGAPLTRVTQGEPGQGRPEILPDARTLVFESDGGVQALDIASGRRVELARGVAPRFAASGHLVVGRRTTLLAAPFDVGRLALTGPLQPLVEGVESSGLAGVHFALSRNGTLAYVPGARSHELVIVGADGRQRVLGTDWLSFENPQFSPDGRRLAVAASRRAGLATDIWIHDLGTGQASRLTFDGGRAPIWRPDGAALTFSHLGEKQGIYSKAADGRGDAQLLRAIEGFHWLIGWTPDSRTLAYGEMERAEDGRTLSSIMTLTDGQARRIVGPGSIWGGRLSPDGRWLAYYTLEDGHFQVYVTSFPDGGARWVVSEEGGRDPSWSPNGAEIYYRSGDRLMAARVDTTAGVRVLRRRLVLTAFSPPLYDDYDAHPDGRTLALVRPREEPGHDIVLVLNWFTELRRAKQ